MLSRLTGIIEATRVDFEALLARRQAAFEEVLAKDEPEDAQEPAAAAEVAEALLVPIADLINASHNDLERVLDAQRASCSRLLAQRFPSIFTDAPATTAPLPSGNGSGSGSARLASALRRRSSAVAARAEAVAVVAEPAEAAEAEAAVVAVQACVVEDGALSSIFIASEESRRQTDESEASTAGAAEEPSSQPSSKLPSVGALSAMAYALFGRTDLI